MKKNVPFLLCSTLLLSFIVGNARGKNAHAKKNRSDIVVSFDSCWSMVGKYVLIFNKTDSAVTPTDFEYKSLPNGAYTLHIEDVFKRNHNVTINLKHDTLLDARKIMGYDEAAQITVAEMEAVDEIDIAYRVDGCFTAQRELTTLKKKKSGNCYRLDQYANEGAFGRSYRDSITSNILNELYKLQMNNIIVGLKRDGGLSTTRRNLFILAGNKLYHFNDSFLEGWNLYDYFMEDALRGRF